MCSDEVTFWQSAHKFSADDNNNIYVDDKKQLEMRKVLT